MKKKVCLAADILLLIIVGTMVVQPAAAATSLTIAHYKDYKPYAYVDQNGRSQGMLVDIWRLWADKNQADLKFLPARLSRCLELVKNGKADIVIGLFRSEERAAFLDFSAPLIHNVDTSLYVKESLNVEAVEALGGIPVGVIKADFAEGFIQQRYPVLKLRTFPGSREIIETAVAGRLTAFVLDFQNATYLLSQRNALTTFKPVARLYTQTLRAGVRKGDVQLVNLINQGLKEISRAERENIYARYGSFSPVPLIARYRYWFIGGSAILLVSLVLIGFYSYRLRNRMGKLVRRRKKSDSADWPALIAGGEGDQVEFKSTLRWNLRTEKADKNLEYVIVKTISAFLNSDGGNLFIGVADDGQLLGLDLDYRSFQKRPNRDGFLLKLSSLISRDIGKEFHKFITTDIQEFGPADICRITVAPADKPAFVKKKGHEEFYIRASAASVPLSLSESHEYIRSHW